VLDLGSDPVGRDLRRIIGLVEALDEGVLIRFAWRNEPGFDTAACTPLGEGDRGELRPVVQAQRSRLTVQLDELLHHTDHPQTRDRVRHFDPEHLAIAFVDEIECPERSPAVERIRDEVQRPDLVQSGELPGVDGCVSASAAWFGEED